MTISPKFFIFSTQRSYFSLKPGMSGHWFSPQSGLLLSGFSTGRYQSMPSWLSALPFVTFSFSFW